MVTVFTLHLFGAIPNADWLVKAQHQETRLGG
jgi:hypothetical protein